MRRTKTIETAYKVLGVVLLSFALSGVGLAKNGDKEKTATETNPCSKKIMALKERIQNKPNDAHALFQLGACYVKTEKYSRAHKYFTKAVRSNPTYKNGTARLYAEAGYDQLQSTQIRQAKILFQKAISFHSDIRLDIAKGVFLQGRRFFDRGLYDLADERFALANSLDDAYGKKICDMFFYRGNSLDTKRAIALYRLTSWYCSDHNEDIGLRMLKTAKDHYSKEWQAIYKDEATKYVSDETIQAVFPNPTWKTVHASVYVGKGYDSIDSPEYHIRTVRFGKEIRNGDKIIVETEGDFKVWNAGWDQYESKCEILAKERTSGEYFYLEGPKDKRIIVKVQRYQ